MRPEKNPGGNNNPHFREVVLYCLQSTVVSYVSQKKKKKPIFFFFEWACG